MPVSPLESAHRAQLVHRQLAAQELVLVLVLVPVPVQAQALGLARYPTSSPTRRTSPEVMLAYR
jgi:hypothetical protein